MQPPTFDRVRDLLDVAIRDEESARDRYLAWQGRAGDGALDDLLGRLAADEERHRAMLQTVRTVGVRLPLTDHLAERPLPDYATHSDDAEPTDVRSLLVYAIRDERRAFLAYVELAETAEVLRVAEACRTLAQEEAAHQRLLEEQYARLFES
jgi:rubrerythrin